MDQITLNINSADALILKDFYQKKIEKLKANHPAIIEYEACRKILDELNRQLPSNISALSTFKYQSDSAQIDSTDRYDKAWTLSRKAEFAILKRGKPSTTREIAEVIAEEQPDIFKDQDIDFDKLQRNIGATLKQKIDKDITFFRFKLGDSIDYHYGLKTEKSNYGVKVPPTLYPE